MEFYALPCIQVITTEYFQEEREKDHSKATEVTNNVLQRNVTIVQGMHFNHNLDFLLPTLCLLWSALGKSEDTISVQFDCSHWDCHECGYELRCAFYISSLFQGQPDAFDVWWEQYKEDYSIYAGNSNAMEVAKRLLRWSLFPWPCCWTGWRWGFQSISSCFRIWNFWLTCGDS